MIKIIGFAMIMILVYTVGAFACYEVGKYFDDKINDSDVNSFDSCVSAGYSVIEIYPRVCVDSFGNSYTEIVNEEIQIPR